MDKITLHKIEFCLYFLKEIKDEAEKENISLYGITALADLRDLAQECYGEQNSEEHIEQAWHVSQDC